MDLITQGLLGSTVAQAGFSRKLGKKTALYGLILGFLPDFDIIARFWGEWASLKYHRGPTHSLILLSLAAIPTGYILKKISGSDKPLKTWVGLSFFSLVTHPLIDWCTTYGTPLWWPLNNNRLANDALPIIDPLYSLPLLAVTLIGIFNLLTPRKRKALALFALMISSLYAFWGYRNSQNIIKKGKNLFKAENFEPEVIRATPTLFNNQLFRVVAKDKNHNFMVSYMKAGNGHTSTKIEKIISDRGKYVAACLNHKHGKLFKWFSMDMLCPKVKKRDDGKVEVNLHDMRYGFMTDLSRSLFIARAVFDENDNIIEFTRIRGSNLSFKQELKRMCEEFF
jgi:inner membrane protein